jgi:glucose-1-phosphate adenylyltransferase
MENVVAVVLGGGRGSRLFPLTQHRSKPAVPIAASYRLIDVAVSNCIHAGLRRIFVVTQYQSESLNRHVASTYKFDAFSSGFVEILAAEQTDGQEQQGWFLGTADAVRKCVKHIWREDWSALAILSGDQLYRMDLREMMDQHRQSEAAVTVATKAVPAEQTSAFGIMKIDGSGRIVHFDEKPPSERLSGLDSPVAGATAPAYLASMGIYIFARAALERALQSEGQIDFGKHVIPSMLPRTRVQAYLYDGYWEDVGTIRSYFDANLALTPPRAAFSFYHPHRPIYTHRRYLAPTKVHATRIHDALLADGCFLDRAEIESCVIGVRTRVAGGARIRRSLILGADFYDSETETSGQPPLGIGEDSVIENAIVDKNARIGRNVTISNRREERERDGDCYFIRDGIVVIPKGVVVPDGTTI